MTAGSSNLNKYQKTFKTIESN